jgi:hypothetical protein
MSQGAEVFWKHLSMRVTPKEACNRNFPLVFHTFREYFPTYLATLLQGPLYRMDLMKSP